MTSKRLSILSVAALIAIVAGVWLASRESSSGGGERLALYPDLKEQLNSVQAVRIFKAGDERAVEIVRGESASGESSWTVTERAGYPADEARLGEFLRSLADAKPYEEKTANPENYKSLGVEDVSDPAASGIRVELSGAQTPVNLIVGKAGVGGQSQYVRRVSEAQSWLVDTSIDTSASPDQWLRKDILDVSADRIQSAKVSIDGEKTYTAAKKSRADADFAVAPLPKGRELSSPAAANGFSTALTGLTLTDVKPASEFEDREPAAEATFTTFDGLVVEVDGWTEEDKRYIALQPAFDAEVAERFKVATTPVEEKEGAESEADDAGAPKRAEGAAAEQETAQSNEGAEGEQKVADAEDDAPAAPEAPNVAEEAEEARERLAGWVYEIPSYKYEQIFKPLEQLAPAE